MTVHVPGPTNDTVEPETVHTPALLASAENATAKPELAVADTVYAEPPTAAPPGGRVVKLIVWGILADRQRLLHLRSRQVAAASRRWSASIVQVPSDERALVEPRRCKRQRYSRPQ